MGSLRIAKSGVKGAELDIAIGLVRRVIADRYGIDLVETWPGACDLELAIAPGYGPEEAEIVDAGANCVRILASTPKGIRFGVGRFIRASRIDAGGVLRSTARGRFAPDCPLRGVYLATHFGNWYEAAPEADVERYLDELAIWGFSAIGFTIPIFAFEGPDDPRTKESCRRARALVIRAQKAGFEVAIFGPNNGGFNDAPQEILAEKWPDDLGRRGYFGVQICPSNPAGREYLRRNITALFDLFADIGLDYTVAWPYDEGGCGCEQCWPWGSRGYLELSREAAEIGRARIPNLKMILSTWMYDTPPAGEWEGLTRHVAENPGWIDYIMADAHEDFPRYPLDVGVPGNLPLIAFPEISMWGLYPWGAFGATPLPGRFERLWKAIGDRVAGGFLYSEGIYEDLNKVLYAGWFADRDRTADDILAEYVAWEFGADIADDVIAAIRILEANHLRDAIGPRAVEADDLLARAQTKLAPRIRESWRWRILRVRAQIDREMLARGGKLEGPVLAALFDELRAIYHTPDDALERVSPPRVA